MGIFALKISQRQIDYGNILIMMKRFMKPLTADIHFYTAMLDEKPIAVFIGDELVGCGRIQEITENSIKIGEARYFRESCTFKYVE